MRFHKRAFTDVALQQDSNVAVLHELQKKGVDGAFRFVPRFVLRVTNVRIISDLRTVNNNILVNYRSPCRTLDLLVSLSNSWLYPSVLPPVSREIVNYSLELTKTNLSILMEATAPRMKGASMCKQLPRTDEGMLHCHVKYSR